MPDHLVCCRSSHNELEKHR
ncbi:hypothetical protein D4764_06G0002250 [Takifugu flavidus]|uniref:Uncharacterized protein n=1 Tax=Takifugu flavidus TaxID=433684 RepID=A0A5C6MV00_9TELE|nr:hypothetical protein D4764_06G0002250 [Takifugu flavidus]